MILGVIDIGSHSCRLKIVRQESNHWVSLWEGLETTRLMQGVSDSGKLTDVSMANTLQALRDFKQQLQRFTVDRFRVVATSAMREAQNAKDFAVHIEKEIGFQVDIISGEEEAALSYAGMRALLPNIPNPLLVDIGGGSTEFYHPDWIQTSLKMGAVRASEVHLTSEQARQILAPLAPLKMELSTCSLVGCGGTVTSLAAIFHHMTVYNREQIQGTRLSQQDIQTILEHLRRLSLKERQAVPGLQPQRAEVIVPGISWLLQIMHFLQAPNITVSDADLREGILIQLGK